MNKKIIYITSARIPTEKAHGYQIMKMCEAFSQAGFSVELVAPRVLNPITLDAFSFYGVPQVFRIHYLRVPRMPRGWLFPFSLIPHITSLLFFIRAARRFIASAASTEAVIYTREGALIPFVSGYAPVTYEVHGFSRTSLFFRWPYASARHIVAMTAGIRSALLRRGVPSAKILVAHDAVDLSAFGAAGSRADFRALCGLSQGVRIVGYIGRFTVRTMEKGVDMLVRSMGILRGTHPDVKLLLVGGPESSIPSYMRSADECGFGRENIIYVPAVPARDVPRFMRSCDMLVIPLPYSLFSAVYTSPLKMFEYMASGVPIVSSDLPALREILNKKNAVFAKAGDACDLAAALSAIFSDPVAASDRARHAYQDVLGYTWHNRAMRIARHSDIL